MHRLGFTWKKIPDIKILNSFLLFIYYFLLFPGNSAKNYTVQKCSQKPWKEYVTAKQIFQSGIFSAMLSLLLLDNNERKQDRMARHDTCRDDNQAGSRGHHMQLTLSPPMTRPTIPKSKLIHQGKKTHYLRKTYICKKGLAEKVGQAFGYEEFSCIKLTGCN